MAEITDPRIKDLLKAIERGDVSEVRRLSEEIGGEFNEGPALNVFGFESIPEDDRLAVEEALAVSDRAVQEAFSLGQIEGGGAQTGEGPVMGGLGSKPAKEAATILSRTTASGAKQITAEGAEFANRLATSNPALAARIMKGLRKAGGWTVGIGAVTAIGAGIMEGGEGGGGVPPAGAAPPGGNNPFRLFRDAQAQAQEAIREQSTDPLTISRSRFQPDAGYNIMVHDRTGQLTGTPGSIAVLSPSDLGAGSGILSPEVYQSVSETPTSGVRPTAGRATSGADLITQGMGQGPGGITPGLRIDNSVIQTISPHTNVAVTINAPIQTAPAPPVPTGRPIGTEADYRPGGILSPQKPTKGQFEQGTDTASRVATGSTYIPAGAKIQPRSFREVRGRTLIEWANVLAKRNGVPLNVLYGIIDHESGWLSTAVGDNGNSFGLAQIYMPVWGEQVSREQALDPVYAMEWAAKNLAANFRRFGRWDAAIAAHNSPVAAAHLAKTGRFQNEKSAGYVASVMSRSNESGLDNVIFAEDELAGTPIDGRGGTNAEYTPYQEPDPASSREFIKQTYQEMLGRQPTEPELVAGVQRISGLSRSQYEANLRQAKGGKSQGVDIEAQFREGIEETGEFEFTEETHQLNSFTDYAAGVARLLQQGL